MSDLKRDIGVSTDNTEIVTVDKKKADYFHENLTKMVSGNRQLGDIVSSDRMLGYTDSIMATCATFLVIPIKKIHTTNANQTLALSSFIDDMQAEFIMFFLGFAVVLTIWENINVRTMVVKRVDDYVLTFVILEMLATTVLPFSLALQGNYPSEKVSIILTCCVLGFIQILDILLICYAIETPRILHIEIQTWSKTELRRFRNIVLIRPLLSLVLVVIGGVLCLVHYAVSWGFIAILTLMPTIRNLFLYVRRRMKTSKKMEKYEFYFFFSKGNIPNERIEVMSDAAVAVIACLLILDITTDEFPLSNIVSEKGLKHVLENMKSEFYTFLATFAMVSTLWYVNHCVLHLFRTINTVALYLQKFFLAFSCLCPLAGNMILKYGAKGNASSITSIRYAGLIVFCASMANFFLFFYGFLTQEKYWFEWAKCDRSFKAMPRQCLYIVFKTLNVPFWSLLCTLGSLGSPKFSFFVLCTCFIASPLTFFFAKLAFMNHIGKNNQSCDTNINVYLNSHMCNINKNEENKQNITKRFEEREIGDIIYDKCIQSNVNNNLLLKDLYVVQNNAALISYKTNVNCYL
ncbi:endosomal/lysosomal proton channel TMEM175 [Hydra vulgaris]|uniref:endosomal/lysosomal proton channel TMEM175 n=1 Tax=Hydra vulgaris TaxID=6087 RepID=UPI001F5E6F24|nr:endosomal/lysosomal potassium channel TMEM175-like [Hydra vulgaris]